MSCAGGTPGIASAHSHSRRRGRRACAISPARPDADADVPQPPSHCLDSRVREHDELRFAVVPPHRARVTSTRGKGKKAARRDTPLHSARKAARVLLKACAYAPPAWATAVPPISTRKTAPPQPHVRAQSVRAPSPSSYSLRPRHTQGLHPRNAPRPTGSIPPSRCISHRGPFTHSPVHMRIGELSRASFHHHASRPASRVPRKRKKEERQSTRRTELRASGGEERAGYRLERGISGVCARRERVKRG
ncbi:hypothetical protein B0H16DRAFT_1472691 [Mycena metata]|uniref:Uncharacterized protein n=1 Tax=Mycena metata TaxID=1033252 RepID=A0AAD7HM04_9AGAR|nr:hypothetical protein B0H16DRAFT_1472691 [Mycena metata]